MRHVYPGRGPSLSGMIGARWLLAAVLASGLLAGLAAGQLKPAGIQAERLDNGLKVLLLPDHDIPNVALYTFFRVGARNERPGLTGVSHFIEHMMFNGTREIGPGEFDRRMEALGGSNNAYTSQDMTAYTDWFPASALEEMIRMEADRIQGLTFEEQVLESERDVVASERQMAVDNDNDGLLAEQTLAAAIIAHPYHWGVIGWMSDIRNWRREEIIQYYRTYYAPSNAVLVLSGDFEPGRALELIRRYYGPIPAGPPPPPVTTEEPAQLGQRRVTLRREALTSSFLMMFHVPGVRHADFPALQLLDQILLGGESGRLHRRLVRQEAIATDVGGGVSATIDPYVFTIRVKPVAGVDPARIEAAIRDELSLIRQKGVQPRELQKAVNQIRTGLYGSQQSIAEAANLIGTFEVIQGDYRLLFSYLDRFQQVTVAELRDLSARYLTDTNSTVGIIIPERGRP